MSVYATAVFFDGSLRGAAAHNTVVSKLKNAIHQMQKVLDPRCPTLLDRSQLH